LGKGRHVTGSEQGAVAENERTVIRGTSNLWKENYQKLCWT